VTNNTVGRELNRVLGALKMWESAEGCMVKGMF
jgi:hypothetical protein